MAEIFKIQDDIKKELPEWITVKKDKRGEILEAEPLEVYKIFFKALGRDPDPTKATFEECQFARWLFFIWIRKFLSGDHPIRVRLMVDKGLKLKKPKKGKVMQDYKGLYEKMKKDGAFDKI